MPRERVELRCAVQKWWAYRHEPNVLLLHYSNFVRDPDRVIRQIVEFLGFPSLPLTDDQLARVRDAVSIATMKRNSQRYLYRINHPDVATMIRPATAAAEGGVVIRKGGLGDSKVTFTAEQDAVYDQALLEWIPDPVMRKWAEDGGEF